MYETILVVMVGIVIFLTVGYFAGLLNLFVWNHTPHPYSWGSKSMTNGRKIIFFLFWPSSAAYRLDWISDEVHPATGDWDDHGYLFFMIFFWWLKVIWNVIVYILLFGKIIFEKTIEGPVLKILEYFFVKLPKKIPIPKCVE